MKTLQDLYDDGKIIDHIGEDDLIYIVQDGEDMVATAAILRDKLRGYSVYSAQISQSGSGAPTVTILENTIGDIVWTRDGAGAYTATLADMFPDVTKVLILTQTSTILISGGTYYYDLLAQIQDSDSFILGVLDPKNHTGSDNGINQAFIEVRVYATPTT
jgi:hypothetical protein